MPGYTIGSLVLFGGGTLPISAEEFRHLVAARNCLLSVLAVEEAYDVVVLNYAAFEKGMLHPPTTPVALARKKPREIKGCFDSPRLHQEPFIPIVRDRRAGASDPAREALKQFAARLAA